MWKREYQENRERKIASDPEYAARVAGSKPSRTPEENREYLRAYYQANKHRWAKRTPEQQAKYNATRRERYRSDPAFREQCKASSRGRDKDAKRDARLRSDFGISAEEYDAILARQRGGCAICGDTTGDGNGRRLHVDHCHASGVVRGLLCAACNFGLGKFKDDPRLLRRAAQYVDRPA